MRKAILATLALSVLCVLVLASGCVFDNTGSEVVVTEKVVVQYSEYRESPSIGSAVVADQWRQRLMDSLKDYGAKIEDVKSITVVSGDYKVTMPSRASHDWTVSGKVTMRRQDDPHGQVTDGPADFVNMTSQSLMAAKGKPVPANLNAAGVAVVNRALQDLLTGGNPRLIVEMVSDNIVPAPSHSDPLDFGWNASVTFQAVVKVKMGGK
jgi:hypothetical protein